MPEVVGRYDYTDESGDLLYQVERLSPKGFRCRRPDPDNQGKWIYNMGDDPATGKLARRVLYRLPDVIKATAEGRFVYFVEGEKDADSMEAQGRIATTVPHGAGKWQDEYAEAVRGGKVGLIFDNDPAGMRHMWKVANALAAVTAEDPRVWRPPAEFKDVTEMLEAGQALKQLVPFEDWRRSPTANQNGATPIRVMSIKELMETPDLAEHDKLLDALVLRGSRLVVGAHTGDGKTTFGLQMLAAILQAEGFLGWKGSGNGTRALVLDAEQGRRTVKRRFVEAGLDQFPDKVELVHVPDGLALDNDARHVAEVEAILANGHYDVVFADPLYKLHRGEANDERKAVDLMRRFDYWRERFSFALILPMHCRKPQPGQNGNLTIHDILGSSGYTRGAEVVCGLQRKSKGFAHLHWFKDREGDLGCLNERWGLKFDQENGFQRADADIENAPLYAEVRAVLERRPGLTVLELREAAGAGERKIKAALEAIGAIHDGAKVMKHQKWQMPPTLFDEGGDG